MRTAKSAGMARWAATKRVSTHDQAHDGDSFAAGQVDINTIRAWLGHVSPATTNVYAEVDLEMKAKSLARCEVEGEKSKRRSPGGKTRA
jgi:hypothetical protein